MSLTFYLDTHISKHVALQLRQRGVMVVRSEDVDLRAATDEQHLTYATQHGHVMVSQDSDFTVLHVEWLEAGTSHCGIMYVSSDVQGEAAISLLVMALYEYFELIENGVGTLEADIHNRIFFL